jgi:Trypsin
MTPPRSLLLAGAMLGAPACAQSSAALAPESVAPEIAAPETVAAPPAPVPLAMGAHPASVVIDFYGAQGKSAACSGTLLSASVVLTSAHCAVGTRGARVTAPDAGGVTSTVDRVFPYGWRPARDPRTQYDLALLSLKTPIRLASYPAVQREPCDGCSVIALYRSREGGKVGADVRETASMRVAAPSADHPTTLFMPAGTGDSGGAVLGTGDRGGLIVGVTVGDGQTSGGGYIARLDNPDVQRWVRDLVYSVGEAD